jgi:hypothetical protein
MCLCIDGALSSRRKIKYMSDDNGNPQTDKQARDYLKMLRVKGHKVMPIGNCYRFDTQKGCKGHIKSLMPTEEIMDKIELDYLLFKQGKRVC